MYDIEEGMLTLTFEPKLLWIVFAVAVMAVVTIGIILLYHWRRYGMKHQMVIFAESLFIFVSFVLGGLALFALIAY